jgi:hypothetical protein
VTTLLQTVSGDIAVTNGQTTLVTDPVLAGAITLQNKFGIFLGEWYRDTRIGWPFFQQVAIKNANPRVAENIIRSVILSTPPFTRADVTVTQPDATRKATCSFVAYSPSGATVTSQQLETPFIIFVPPGATS